MYNFIKLKIFFIWKSVRGIVVTITGIVGLSLQMTRNMSPSLALFLYVNTCLW